MLFELVEVLVPESFVVVNPSRNLPEGFSPEGDEDLSALFPALDETGSFEQLKVFGHRVQGGVEGLRDVQESGGSACQLQNNRPTRWV